MSKERQKGTSFETALLPFLQIIWPEARRTGSASFGDGDFANTAPFAIEAKNQKELRLASWIDQINMVADRIEVLSHVRLHPVVMHKRPRKGTHKAYVTMEVETFIKCLAEQYGLPYPDDFSAMAEKMRTVETFTNNTTFDYEEQDEE
jgi:hypothetical protein